MIPKGTRRLLSEGCGWCFIPSWKSRAFKQYDGSRKKRKLTVSAHQTNKLERLLFEELRQCDVCGKNILCKAASQETSVAEDLPKFVEKHIMCQSPLSCRWCEDPSDRNNKYPSCDSLFCNDKCRTRAECAFDNNVGIRRGINQLQSSSVGADKDILIPPPKLFFCQNRLQRNDSGKHTEFSDDLTDEAAQSLSTIEAKLRNLCGNNLSVDECALLITTILSILSPSWLHLFSGDEQIDGNTYEESLSEELWSMARSHWSILVLLQANEQSDDDGTKQQFMSCQVFYRTYLYIKRQCISQVALPDHLLTTYSNTTLMSAELLSDDERDLALDILKHPCIPISHAQSKTNDADQQSIIRWRNISHTAHWLSHYTSLVKGNGLGEIQSHLGRTQFVFAPLLFERRKHSCCPITMLDINDPRSPLESLSWISLHDVGKEEHLNSYSVIDNLEDNVRSREAELKKFFGSDFICTCSRCRYETSATDDLNQYQLKQLADLAMQQGRYSDSFELYESIVHIKPSDDNFLLANVLHAKAAAALGNASTSFVEKGHCDGYFLAAQRLWKEAGSDHNDPEINIHVEKQRVFGTLDENYELDDSSASTSTIQYSTYLRGKCFLTSESTPVLTEDECRFVIQTAEEYCNDSTGWTTARHYAVPTTDVPVHEITKLHHLFTEELWLIRIRPLLRQQFKLKKNRQIFIHDAFVVRYDSAKQRYLPPHIDESSHSFIIALNSGFKGGGTYIHELGHVLSPTVGSVASFEGGTLLHSGDPVISGIRYCIVAFCYIDKLGETEGSNAKMATSDETAGTPFVFGFQFS